MFNKSFAKGLAITLTAVTIVTGASAAFSKPAYAGDVPTESMPTNSECTYDLDTEKGLNAEYTFDPAVSAILSSIATDSSAETAAASDTKTTDSSNTETKENSSSDSQDNAGISAPLPAGETYHDSKVGQHILEYLTKVPDDKKTDADKFFESLLKYTNLGSLLTEYFENGTGMKDEKSLNGSEKTFLDQLLKAITGSAVNTDLKECLVKLLGDSYGKLVGYYGAALNAISSVDELIKAFECSNGDQIFYHLVKSLEKAGFAYISVLPGGGYIVAGINVLESAWNTAVADAADWLADEENRTKVINFFCNDASIKDVNSNVDNDLSCTSNIGPILYEVINNARKNGTPLPKNVVENAKKAGICTTGITVIDD